MTWLNLSGTLSFFRLFKDPSLCLPHCTISTFAQLPVPIHTVFSNSPSPSAASATNTASNSEKNRNHHPDIRAIVLDKDNCFATPHSLTIHPSALPKFTALRAHYPSSSLLIVSNTAGTTSDPGYIQAAELEKNTGVAVLRHDTKKPGCGDEVMKCLRTNGSGVERPEQVVVVGDRLLTDVMMGNMMGAWSVWIRDGVEPPGFMARLETRLADGLVRRGWKAQLPENPFE